MPDKTLVTTARAAELLSIGVSTLNRWAREGLVKPTLVTAGGHHRWDVDDLREQLAQIQQRED